MAVQEKKKTETKEAKAASSNAGGTRKIEEKDQGSVLQSRKIMWGKKEERGKQPKKTKKKKKQNKKNPRDMNKGGTFNEKNKSNKVTNGGEKRWGVLLYLFILMKKRRFWKGGHLFRLAIDFLKLGELIGNIQFQYQKKKR